MPLFESQENRGDNVKRYVEKLKKFEESLRFPSFADISSNLKSIRLLQKIERSNGHRVIVFEDVSGNPLSELEPGYSLSTGKPVSIQDISFLMSKISFSSALLSVYLLYLFVRNYPEESTNRINAILVSILVLVVLILSWTPLVNKGIDIINGNPNVQYGPLYPFYALVLFSLVVILNLKLIAKFVRSEGQIKAQILFLTIGYLIASIFALLLNLIIPLFTGSSYFSRYGPLSAAFFVITTAYAIVRYRFLDIRILIGRAVYFIILGTILFFVYYFTDLLNSLIWETSGLAKSAAIAIPVSIFFVIFYDQFKSFIQNNVENRLINPDFDPKTVIANFNNVVSSSLSYRRIIVETISVIRRTIRPDREYIFIFSDELRKYEASDREFNFDIQSLKKIWEHSNNASIVFDDLNVEIPESLEPLSNDINVILNEMKRTGIKVIVPIYSPNLVLGMMLIGHRDSDAPYNAVQVEYLESISKLAGLALTRALLFEEVEEFNKTLRKRIRQATKEINDKNKELAEALRKEKDMMDILAHELKTPLTVVKNGIDLMDLKLQKLNINDPGVERAMTLMKANITKEISLLESILASSKLDNSELKLNMEKVSANDIVLNTYESFKVEADRKKLKLSLTPLDDKMHILADPIRVQQVLDNFVSNAIKYTRKGSVEIGAFDRGQFIEFFVKDTGEGIPKESLDNLGKKFYRVEKSGSDGKKNRPPGTGIGLYVAFRLIRSISGKYDIESQVGKGSTFKFSLSKFETKSKK